MAYKCKYFKIKELVHPDLLKQLPESTLWLLFDERLLRGLDIIREIFGPCTVNTPTLDGCGLVPFNSTRDAKFSPHKFGRAVDIHVISIEKDAALIADPVARKKFKIAAYNNFRERLMLDDRLNYLNFENNVGWGHTDTYNRPNRLFNP